jgi:O-antigen/teichoic acid export membrane protein
VGFPNVVPLVNSAAYLRTFLSRQGHWVVAANVITKLLGFAAVVFVTRHTTEQAYGAYSYAMNLVGATVPFMGLGAYQAFLRFASDAPGASAKKQLFSYAFSRGIVFSLGLIAVLQLAASWLCQAIPESVLPFRLVSFVVLTTLVMEYVKSYARAIHLNHVSAYVDLTYAVLLVTFTVLLTQGMGIAGYAAAVAASPVLAALPYAKKLGLLRVTWGPLGEGYSGFWSYGLFTTAGALLAQLFYSVDVVMIGHFVGENASAVAVYRIALLIPMATSVLPISVAATDFVKNSANKHRPVELREYVWNYWKTFGLVSCAAIGTLWILAPSLLTVFGEGYVEGASVMRVFLVGTLGAHLFRVPFGHLLSAVGRADWNTYVNAAVFVLTAVACYLAVPRWGIHGAAASMAAMLWVSGLMYALMFGVHLRAQKHD